MSLFSSQTIFNLLITLIIGTALYYYMKYKFRILELTQREHAKVLQSVIMSMNTNNSGRGVANQSGGEYSSMGNLQNLEEDMNRFREINKNELIDVSDEDDESEDEDSETDSSESSESGDDTSDDEIDEIDENGNLRDNNNTKKIVITNNHDSHKVEHLTGPDIKVIELTHPLYSNNETVEDMTGHNEDEDEDEDDECEDESDSESDSESSAENEDGSHEIKDTVSQKQEQEQTLEECTNMAIDNSLDNISVTTVFKNKNNDNSVDYNTMTVSVLRQMLKSKFVSDGHHMSETSINKLSKKDIIKMLQ